MVLQMGVEQPVRAFLSEATAGPGERGHPPYGLGRRWLLNKATPYNRIGIECIEIVDHLRVGHGVPQGWQRV